MTNAQVATLQLLWPLLPMLLRGQQHDLSPVVLALQVVSFEEEQLRATRQKHKKHWKTRFASFCCDQPSFAF